MKEKLKYIIAVLTAGTVGAWFLTYAKIGTAEFSLLGTLKAGLGFYKGTEEQELIYTAARTCLEPYTWWIAVGVFLILLGAFLIAVLGKESTIYYWNDSKPCRLCGICDASFSVVWSA